jgi:hypothetical protein
MKRIGLLLTLAALLCGAPAMADSDQVGEFDTKHIFGFTEGTDIGAPDEHEAEFTTTAHFLKRGGGRYSALEQEATDEGALTSWLGYELTLHGAASQTRNAVGLDSLRQASFSGVSSEPKFTLLKRAEGAPFSLSLSFQPEWDRIDNVSGEHADNLSLPIRLMADSAYFNDRLYAGANLLYAPERDRDNRAPVADSTLFGATGALTWRLASQVSLGGELEYYAAWRSLHFSDPVGTGVYLGPTFFARVSPNLFFAGGWSAQIAGRPAQSGRLADYNRMEFSRQRARLTFGVAF